MKNFLPNIFFDKYSELVKAHLWVSHSVQETITATARFIIAALTFVIVHLDPDQLTDFLILAFLFGAFEDA